VGAKRIAAKATTTAERLGASLTAQEAALAELKYFQRTRNLFTRAASRSVDDVSGAVVKSSSKLKRWFAPIAAGVAGILVGTGIKSSRDGDGDAQDSAIPDVSSQGSGDGVVPPPDQSSTDDWQWLYDLLGTGEDSTSGPVGWAQDPEAAMSVLQALFDEKASEEQKKAARTLALKMVVTSAGVVGGTVYVVRRVRRSARRRRVLS